MRKNVKEVFAAFHKGEPKRGESIHTDGDVIYSYNTAIVERIQAFDPLVAFNHQKFSATTSAQQHALRLLLIENGYRIIDATAPINSRSLECHIPLHRAEEGGAK